jgi:hypothetical protein
VRGPEPVQEVPHCGQTVGANQEQVASAFAPLGDEACTAKDPQMVRHDLLRDPKLQRYLPDGQRVIANPRENAAPGAVRQRVQSSIDCFCMARHLLNSSRHLYKCQLVDKVA